MKSFSSSTEKKSFLSSMTSKFRSKSGRRQPDKARKEMEINSKYKRCFANVLSTAGLSAFRYFEIRKTKPKVITTANQNKAKFQMKAMRIMMINT